MDGNNALNYYRQLQHSQNQPYETPSPPKSFVEQREQDRKRSEELEKQKEYSKRYLVLKRNI